ncbi:multivesicular body subunit 12A [Eublepharis macularius]|uniref:Multivesicular body subunit 12A n=1 Tax=Eublepharis macularius TaxID=481883 RepID=A0AA97LM04_EUBMA|nr:multivesicular body subunit 12A [Eublepharis macularius]
MNTPLTGLGWTSAASVAPAGWTAITTTVEGASANFGKGFAQKSGYYLCFTSTISSENPAGDIIADVVILSDKSPLPSGYVHVKEFLDPKTSVSKKKRLCLKLIPLGATELAVFEILVSSKSKVLPNYLRIGEMSGFALWCKKDHVLKPKPLPKPRKINLEMKQLSLEPDNTDAPPEKPAAPFGPKRQATLKPHESIYESSNVYAISAMDGVPFALHPKFENSISSRSSASSFFKDVHIKSLTDIEKEYNYGFVVERTAAARLPPTIS